MAELALALGKSPGKLLDAEFLKKDVFEVLAEILCPKDNKMFSWLSKFDSLNRSPQNRPETKNDKNTKC